MPEIDELLRDDPESYEAITPGSFIKATTEVLLPRVDGTLDASLATAGNMAVLLEELVKQAGEAKKIADTLPVSVRGVHRLQAYASYVLHTMRSLQRFVQHAYIDRDRADIYTGPMFFCVTSPLLLGWEGNSRCDGVSKKQKTQKPPLAGEPLAVIRQAQTMGAFVDSSVFRSMAEFVFSHVLVVAHGTVEITADVYDATKEILEDVAEAAKDIVEHQIKVTIGGLVLIGGAAALYFTRKRRRV